MVLLLQLETQFSPMILCLLCLIKCSEVSFSVDDDNANIDNEMQLVNVPDVLLSCKKDLLKIKFAQH